MPKQPPKKSQTAKSSRKQADAVHMLKADHKQVKQLFERFHSAPPEERSNIAGQLFTELEVHTKLEEELFYPAVREKIAVEGPAAEDATEDNSVDIVTDTDDEVEDDDELEVEAVDGTDLDADDVDDDEEELITVAYDEHQVAKDLIEQLRSLDAKASEYEELFSELEEAVLERYRADIARSVTGEIQVKGNGWTTGLDTTPEVAAEGG